MANDIPNKQTHFQGRYLTAYSYDQPLLDGSVERWEAAEWRPVAKLFVFPSERSILLADEYRYDDGRRVLRIPGGFLEDGETPEQAARREAQEELGVLPGAVQVYARYSNWGPVGNPMLYACACSRLSPSRLPGDPGEDVVPVEMALDEARERILGGDLANDWAGLILLRMMHDLERGRLAL